MKRTRIKAGGLIITTLLICAGCGSETPPPAAGGDSSWLAEAMQSKEYLAACEETPGCSTDPIPAYETERVWRVRVVHSGDGAYDIEAVEPLDVKKGDGVPLGALYGEVALVGLDAAGDVLDGQLLRFPPHEESVPEGLQHRHLPVSESRVVAYGYIRANPEIRTLAVQDQEKQILASREAPELADNSPGGGWLDWLGIAPAWALNRPFVTLPPACSHIIVLQGEEDRHIAEGNQWGDRIRLTGPGPYQLAAMQAALSSMTPLLCQSIGRIGVGLVRGSSHLGAVNSWGAGDLVMINVAGPLSEDKLEEEPKQRFQFEGTIIHEAAHAAETLLTIEGVNRMNYVGSWGFPARTLANETIDNVRLEIGLPEEWIRLHRAFMRYHWAEGYGEFRFPSEDPSLMRQLEEALRSHLDLPDLDDAPDWSIRDLVRGGFMSPYSSTNHFEDIADFVANTYMGRKAEEADMGRNDFACMVMQRHEEKNLPAEWSAAYTKLYFLLDLGLVREEDVKWCTGEKIGVHVRDKGFHIWRDGNRLRTFDNDMKASMGTLPTGTKVFEAQAKGEAGFGDGMYPAEMNLRLDLGGIFKEFELISLPRGVYSLGLRGDNNFTMRLDGAKAGNFDTMDGFVLISESSRKRIVGSIVLRLVMRFQAPLPVPERYDPPLVIRFRLEGSGA